MTFEESTVSIQKEFVFKTVKRIAFAWNLDYLESLYLQQGVGYYHSAFFHAKYSEVDSLLFGRRGGGYVFGLALSAIGFMRVGHWVHCTVVKEQLVFFDDAGQRRQQTDTKRSGKFVPIFQ